MTDIMVGLAVFFVVLSPFLFFAWKIILATREVESATEELRQRADEMERRNEELRRRK